MHNLIAVTIAIQSLCGFLRHSQKILYLRAWSDENLRNFSPIKVSG